MALNFNVRAILTEYQSIILGQSKVTKKTFLSKYQDFFKFMNLIIAVTPKSIKKNCNTYLEFLNMQLNEIDTSQCQSQEQDHIQKIVSDHVKRIVQRITKVNYQSNFLEDAINYVEAIFQTGFFDDIILRHVRMFDDRYLIENNLSNRPTTDIINGSAMLKNPSDDSIEDICRTHLGAALYNYSRKLHAAEKRTPAA